MPLPPGDGELLPVVVAPPPPPLLAESRASLSFLTFSSLFSVSTRFRRSSSTFSSSARFFSCSRFICRSSSRRLLTAASTSTFIWSSR